MGGRGGAGGGVGSGGLPKVQRPVESFPALTGTEKQVKWANKIRDEVYDTLVGEMYKTESGFRTEAPNYITSAKDMQTWVKQTRDAFQMSNSRILKEKVNNSIDSLRKASDQYGRIRSLIEKETSAKFWIDHRSTHPGDPAWKAFKKKIIGY
jgi:hypothetical protein